MTTTTTTTKRMERIEKNLKELGSCYAQGNTKGNYKIHPVANYPHEKDIKSFTSLVNLEKWIQIKKLLKKEEKQGKEYSADLLQELDMLERGIK